MPCVGKRLSGALRGFRLGTQALHFGFRPRPPCRSQLAGAANRARAIAMSLMQNKRTLKQVRDLSSAAGIGPLGSACRLRRGAQPGHRGLHLVGARHRKSRESAQQCDLTLAFRFDCALQDQLHGIEIPRCDPLPVDRLRTGPRPFIVERCYLCIPLATSGLGGANLFFALASPLAQPPAGVHKGIEPQRRRHRVVQVGRSAVGDRAQLVVWQKRAIRGDSLVPAERGASAVSQDAADAVGTGGQVRTLRPLPSHGKRLPPAFYR